VSFVLDASALISLLDGEPGGAAVAAVLQDGASVSAVNFAEARDTLTRRLPDPSRVRWAVDEIVHRGLRVIDCDRQRATEAADLRAGHYHRAQMPVSLADCIAIVTARGSGGTLVTSDSDQGRLAAEIGVEVLAIANSGGILPDVGRFSR
jgi:PIN domain nuclease of toxin-antitoxin system